MQEVYDMAQSNARAYCHIFSVLYNIDLCHQRQSQKASHSLATFLPSLCSSYRPCHLIPTPPTSQSKPRAATADQSAHLFVVDLEVADLCAVPDVAGSLHLVEQTVTDPWD